MIKNSPHKLSDYKSILGLKGAKQFKSDMFHVSRNSGSTNNSTTLLLFTNVPTTPPKYTTTTTTTTIITILLPVWTNKNTIRKYLHCI